MLRADAGRVAALINVRLTEKAQGGFSISSRLHRDVDNVYILIDGALKMSPSVTNPNIRLTDERFLRRFCLRRNT